MRDRQLKLVPGCSPVKVLQQFEEITTGI